MIFHAVRGEIKALSIVREPHRITARPEELVGQYAGGNHGYLVCCNYTYINDPISAWDYTEQIVEYCI